MMAFYKLFHIIHKRTDFIQMWRIMDELMYPEFYGRKRQQAKNSIMKLALMTNICKGISGYSDMF